jgi:DNA-binding transcriptional MocR family regulator
MMDPFRGTHAIGAADLERTAGGWRALPQRALHRRLAAAIGAAVRDGRLPLGVRLPSERALAARLGVSRKTVVSAYGLLRRESLLESRRGAGHYARRRPGTPAAPFPIGATGDEASLDLAFAAPFDAAPELADAVAQLDATALVGWHGYAPLGLPGLRQAIADRYTARGAPTTADQILVTNGAQHAIQIVLQAFVGLGDRVLVESPTYPLVLDALRARRAAVFSTRVDPRDGWDVDAFAALLASERPVLAIVIPDCHMPTGRTMPAADRVRLAEAACDAGTTLLVDETLADLHEGEPLAPICAASDDGIVSVGSTSKAAWGGLRVGWLRARPATVQRLSQLRAALDIAGPPIDQLVALALLEQWPAIAKRRREQAAARRQMVGHELAERLPDWRWHAPDGGLCLWLRLPRAGSVALAQAAPAHGLSLVPGTRFALDRDLDQYLRLPHVLPPAELRTAVERLAALDRALAADETAGHSTPI